MRLFFFFLPLLITSPLYAQSVSITFEVNMSYQIDIGEFDPLTETVDIAGSFNGWGSPEAQLFDEDGDSTYTITLSGFSTGTEIAFKFRQNFAWDGTEEFPGAVPIERTPFQIPTVQSAFGIMMKLLQQDHRLPIFLHFQQKPF